MHVLDKHTCDQCLSRSRSHDSNDILPDGLLEYFILICTRHGIRNGGIHHRVRKVEKQ